MTRTQPSDLAAISIINQSPNFAELHCGCPSLLLSLWQNITSQSTNKDRGMAGREGGREGGPATRAHVCSLCTGQALQLTLPTSASVQPEIAQKHSYSPALVSGLLGKLLEGTSDRWHCFSSVGTEARAPKKIGKTSQSPVDGSQDNNPKATFP